MMESFKFNGLWWLPNNPDERVAGVLEFDTTKGAKLELIGALEELREFGNVYNHEIILGLSITGKEVTLYKCLMDSTNLNLPGIMTSSYTASYLFIGKHFTSEDELVFDYFDVSYQYAEEWARITGFKVKVENDEKNSMKQYTIDYNFPETIRACLDDGTELLIESKFSSNVNMIKQVDLSQRLIFNFKPPSPLGLNNFINGYFYNFECFLSLAVGKPIYPVMIQAHYNGQIEEPSKNDISIFLRLGREIKQLEQIHLFDMNFTLNDLRENINLYLNNWFGKAENIKPVYDLFFATIYNSEAFLESQFLTLTQAIESYHRRMVSGSYIDNKRFDELYLHFLSNIPEELEIDFKESIKDKLRYLNEFSLRKRLKQLFLKFGELFELIIGNQKVFINEVVDTRNYLTHYDKQLESKALREDQLFQCLEQLKALLQTIFLYEIGFSNNFIKTVLTTNRQYQYVRNIKNHNFT